MNGGKMPLHRGARLSGAYTRLEQVHSQKKRMIVRAAALQMGHNYLYAHVSPKKQ